ncbi:uncharacterized protein LOC118747070 [Rhagoletis pomonella]|uniref:uncharacterized protein LOC118747070 n=1 Tax=Rhagoletis pomonella TaxID=28610 RepID=UPI0017864BE3|nr:uncharacterized protein LOC118747070 [Rhagoletis pomonella]
MKVTVLALIFGLCLAVAAAYPQSGIDYSIESEELEEFTPLEYAEDTTDEEAFSILGFLYLTIRASLRTLKGVNCTVKRVLTIRTAGVDFLDAVQDCNTGASKEFNALVNQVQAVVNTTNDIINVNTNVCHNGALDAAADAKKTTPIKCFFKLLGKTITLKHQISKTISLSKKLPSTSSTYGGCAKTSVNDLVAVFTEFPTFVKTCSRLRI